MDWDIQDVNMKIIDTIQDGTNFKVELVEWVGSPAIRKTLNPNAESRRAVTFKNELLGMEVFDKLAQTYPEWGMRVPKVYEKGEGWMIREFIDGNQLIDHATPLESARENLSRLAVQLAAIDRVEPDKTIPEHEDSAPYTDIRKRFSKWSEKPLAAGILDQNSYDGVNVLIDDYTPYLTPRYAHGDLNCIKHVLVTENNQLAWIDFEHFSAHKPRYYDLAYGYSRLFTQSQYPEVAGELLKVFLENAEPTPHRDEQLLAVMSQRAIGMHFDAMNDLASVDYRDRAQDFLARCLSRRIQNLLDFNV